MLVKDIAIKVGYSSSRNFCAQFKSTLRVTPDHYRTSLRMVRAETVLQDLSQDRPLEEVVKISGFLSYQKMYRAFKRKHGQSPSEYKRACRREKIVGLMKDPDNLIQDIVKECGLASYQSLYWEVTQNMGMAPSQYQALVQQQCNMGGP